MSIVWAIPVAAAALATILVVARARALEDATVDLVHEVKRLPELRPRLTAVRSALHDTHERATELGERHRLRPDPDATRHPGFAER